MFSTSARLSFEGDAHATLGDIVPSVHPSTPRAGETRAANSTERADVGWEERPPDPIPELLKTADPQLP